MKRTDTEVASFLDTLEGQQGDDMRTLDRAIVTRMPSAGRHLYEGKFWGGSEQQIVGYGVMDYTNRSGEDVEWFLIGVAAQKTYISMYVNAVVDGEYLLRRYERRLGKVKVGSASISFGSLAAVDFDMLMKLVEEAAETL